MHHYIKKNLLIKADCMQTSRSMHQCFLFPGKSDYCLPGAVFLREIFFLNLLVSDLHHDILVETVKITSQPLIYRTEVKVEFIV